jgi:xanthine dehydrogenase YagT iron-sulfur-binding subunit
MNDDSPGRLKAAKLASQDRRSANTSQPKQDPMTITRRGVITGGVAAIGAATMPPVGLTAPVAAPTKGMTRITVNGRSQELDLDPRTTLLDALREKLHLTGTKKGCDQGQCGACTVLIDGHRVLSCLTLVAATGGKSVQTIEGLAGEGTQLHPMQQSFIECDAFQCGYCTPGQIMSAIGCVHEGHANSDADIREAMSGNLCRCGAYPNIVTAINQAKTKMRTS